MEKWGISLVSEDGCVLRKMRWGHSISGSHFTGVWLIQRFSCRREAGLSVAAAGIRITCLSVAGKMDGGWQMAEIETRHWDSFFTYKEKKPSSG